MKQPVYYLWKSIEETEESVKKRKKRLIEAGYRVVVLVEGPCDPHMEGKQ